jgi:hypothetical protein
MRQPGRPVACAGTFVGLSVDWNESWETDRSPRWPGVWIHCTGAGRPDADSRRPLPRCVPSPSRSVTPHCARSWGPRSLRRPACRDHPGTRCRRAASPWLRPVTRLADGRLRGHARAATVSTSTDTGTVLAAVSMRARSTSLERPHGRPLPHPRRVNPSRHALVVAALREPIPVIATGLLLVLTEVLSRPSPGASGDTRRATASPSLRRSATSAWVPSPPATPSRSAPGERRAREFLHIGTRPVEQHHVGAERLCPLLHVEPGDLAPSRVRIHDHERAPGPEPGVDWGGPENRHSGATQSEVLPA